jgi:hypothetical protein
MQLLFFLCFLHLRNKFMLIMDTNNSPIHTFPSEWVSPKTNLHRISLHASSDCTKTPSSRAFTSHASNCNCRQSQNKTGKKKQKKQVNPCQSVLPSSWWLICHFFSGKVLYCMINRAYTCKSVCKCACVCARRVPLTHEASSMPSCVADTSKFKAYKFAPPIHFANSCHKNHSPRCLKWQPKNLRFTVLLNPPRFTPNALQGLYFRQVQRMAMTNCSFHHETRRILP